MAVNFDFLKGLKTKEDYAIAEMVLELSRIEREKSYREAGYSSMFSLCSALGYQGGSAWRRINAARYFLQHEDAYEKLKDGSLSLCVIDSLSRVKSVEDQKSLMKVVEGKSKREVEKLVAEHLPATAFKKDSARVVRAFKPAAPTSSPMPLFEVTGVVEEKKEIPPPVETENYHELKLYVDSSFMKLLERAKVHLGPVKDTVALRKGLEKFIADKEAPVKRKGKRRTLKNTRHILKHVREEVKQRDGCQCTYVSSDGHRCSETMALQFDHIKPHAVGGESTVENLRLRCRAHNLLGAEEYYGAEIIKRHIAQKCHQRRSARNEADVLNAVRPSGLSDS